MHNYKGTKSHTKDKNEHGQYKRNIGPGCRCDWCLTNRQAKVAAKAKDAAQAITDYTS